MGVQLGAGYAAGLGNQRSLRLPSSCAGRRFVCQSEYRGISCLSPFINCDAFIDQLLQFIHLLLSHIHKPNPERSINRPLYPSLFNQNRGVVSWDNQLDSDLLSRLDIERAFDSGAAER